MADIETIEKTIDDHTVRCTPHKGRPGARLLARLLRHLGPALGALSGVDIDLTQGIQNVDVTQLMPAIGKLFEILAPDEFDALSCEILSRCSVVIPDRSGNLKNYDLSKPAMIDDAFAGDLMLMFKVMGWALEVNYSGFFHALARSGAAAAAREGAVTDSSPRE